MGVFLLAEIGDEGSRGKDCVEREREERAGLF